MSYIDHIEGIAANDAKVLRAKDREYGGSWLKRGGIGAFMMLARKWDRLEQAVTTMHKPGEQHRTADQYDIIGHAYEDKREEGLLDDIGDLRRYLLLVEAEVRERLGRQPELTSIDTQQRAIVNLGRTDPNPQEG